MREPLPYLVDSSIEAIGEIGLDYSRPIDHTAQQALFEEQLSLAERLGLPVVIHCVRAFEPTMVTLAAFNLRAVIFHGFIGSLEQAQRALCRGYYLSFGHRTFTSPKTLTSLRDTPIAQLFFETDMGHTSIEEIYSMAAAVRGESEEAIKDQIYKNYKAIFKRQ